MAVVESGGQTGVWDAFEAACSAYYDSLDSGPSPQPANPGGGALYEAEADQVAGKLSVAIGIWDAERYARMSGEGS